jgi:hypothetical protein
MKFSLETHTPFLTGSVRQNRFAKTFRCCLVALGFLAASQLAADADTILGYNTTYPFPFWGPEADVTEASAFTVGAQDVEITSIQFILNAVYPTVNTAAYIFSDSSGSPGVILGSSHRSFLDTANGGFTDYAFANPLALSADST